MLLTLNEGQPITDHEDGIIYSPAHLEHRLSCWSPDAVPRKSVCTQAFVRGHLFPEPTRVQEGLVGGYSVIIDLHVRSAQW